MSFVRVLNVAEKNDAAKELSKILSGGQQRMVSPARKSILSEGLLWLVPPCLPPLLEAGIAVGYTRVGCGCACMQACSCARVNAVVMCWSMFLDAYL